MRGKYTGIHGGILYCSPRTILNEVKNWCGVVREQSERLSGSATRCCPSLVLGFLFCYINLMPRNIKKFLILFSIVLLLVIGFEVGFYFGKSQAPVVPIEGLISQELGKPEGVDFSLFWDAWRKVQDKYVSPQNIDIQKMVYGAISGMVKSLNDPYTVFFNPEENKKFIEDVKGTFEGIGAEIGRRKGQLLIISPLEGTPAQKAGLRPGDKIIKINETLTSDLTVEEAVSLIRGPKGTEVILTIFRDEWDKSKEIKIIRGVIEIPSLKWEILARNASRSDASGKDSDIAYLKLYQFSEKADGDFKKAVSEILKSSAQKIILDLRGNPGGYLEVSQSIASWFLPKDQIVAIEDFGGKQENKEYLALGNAKFLDWPMVILVNQGSASASEILAGALRDNRQILLIGEKTFGKGSVQELTDLKSGSSLKITVAKWLTPKGVSISEQGLEPDIKVEITDKDIEEDKDPQLDKAIEIIKEMR